MIREWDGDWIPIESELESAQVAEELKRELCAEHILNGQSAVALGRRSGRDDVLFALDNGRVAQVHLTWRAETDPRWPSTDIFPSFEVWKAVPIEDR